MSSLLFRRLGRQLPRLMACSTSLHARVEIQAGMQTLSRNGRMSLPFPSALHGPQVRSVGPVPALLVINRACNTTPEEDYPKLVKKLSEAVEKHRLDTNFFHIMVVLLLGGLLASTGGLANKINKNDVENSHITHQLMEQKAKADALAKEVEFLAAQVLGTDTSMGTSAPTSTSSSATGTASTDGSATGAASTDGSATGAASTSGSAAGAGTGTASTNGSALDSASA